MADSHYNDFYLRLTFIDLIYDAFVAREMFYSYEVTNYRRTDSYDPYVVYFYDKRILDICFFALEYTCNSTGLFF